MTILQGLTLGNAQAGCVFAGPDAPLCMGAVMTLNLLVTGVNQVGYQVAVYNGESQCMQGQ